MVGIEVADTDGPDEALVTQVAQRLPRLDIRVELRRRPVDQVEVEVEVVQAGAMDALLDGDSRLVVGMVAAGKLGGDDEFGPIVAGGAHAPPGGTLILVVECRIEQRVAVVVRPCDRVGAGGAIESIGTEADDGQGQPVVGSHRGNRGHGRPSWIGS